MPHTTSNYTLGSTDAELQRLVDLASHEEDRVIDACGRAGIGKGAFVLDVGCGPLGALSALSRVVGESGRVVGIDASSSALGKARSLLPAAEFPQLHFINAALQHLERESVGEVDLAYCRLMLLHQPEPGAAVEKMSSFVKRGGFVIAHEPSDLPTDSPASDPFVPAMRRVWELVIAAARARGARTDFGRRGRHYLEAAGLEVVSPHSYVIHYPAGIGYEIPRVALNSLRPVLAEQHLAGADEIEHLDRELTQAKSRADVQWVSSPLMFEWIARKP